MPAPQTPRRDAVDRLGAATRRLRSAVVGTEAPDDVLADVVAQLDALTDLLAAHPRAAGEPPSADRRDDGGLAPTGASAFDPATGSGSPVAPPLTVTRAHHAATGTCRLGAVQQGAPSAVHGGVLALLLETMTGQAVLGDDQPRLVSKLAIAYRGPVPQDADLVLEARVTSAEDTRWRVTTTLATAAEPGTVLTECQGTVLQLRPDQLARHRALQA